MRRIADVLARAERAVVLTGAGISVAAGLPTYRGAQGLWETKPELANTLRAGVAPAVLWRELAPMRQAIRAAAPTRAHAALATLAERARARGATFTVITQNIDGLHARAGQADLIELHGRLARSRCTGCSTPSSADETDTIEVPLCPSCGAPLRPDIVLFDEPLGAREEVDAKRAFRGADAFVAIGTSGRVDPAARFVRWARFEGAFTACVDLAPPEPTEAGFEVTIAGAADEVVPSWLG
jgi:NAD-dependent deacetylase